MTRKSSIAWLATNLYPSLRRSESKHAPIPHKIPTTDESLHSQPAIDSDFLKASNPSPPEKR